MRKGSEAERMIRHWAQRIAGIAGNYPGMEVKLTPTRLLIVFPWAKKRRECAAMMSDER